MILSDPAAERAVLSGICSYGEEVYLEIADIIKETCFTIDSNAIVYKCIRHIYDKHNALQLDIASIYSAASEIGVSHILNNKEEAQHLKAILDFPVNKDNIKKFAAKIKKLEIARSLHKELENVQDKILDINGSESVSGIVGIAEEAVMNFGNTLNDIDNNPVLIAKDLNEYMEYLASHPIDQVGIPTGFPIYDQSIGGGLRRSTVNVIAARPKTGKTLLVDNMGFHIASKLKIPVLNLDTEMTKEDHLHRILAMVSETEIRDIETGKFTSSEDKRQKINKATEELKNAPIYYKSIAGKPFDEQLSIIRRWLIKHVGLNDNGKAKDCVIFYDYLKLMDTQGMSQDLKEYQLLGFMMTQLHNLATQYEIPIVAFVQLNRDGITKESTDTASGSDRIIWLCSNFTIFKRKSDEEIAEDGPTNGNRKLVPIISRHGGGLDDNDYINCHMKGWCAKIAEGKTKLELTHNKGKQTEGFVLDDQNNEKIEFV
jgi:replicative DNA helicase